MAIPQMTPAEIRDATLSQLRAARTAMFSAEWMLSLEGKDKQTQTNAAKQLLRVHHAIQQLENAELATIKDDLLKNEEDLANGRVKLGNALRTLNRVKSVLNALSGLLGVIAKVAKLIL